MGLINAINCNKETLDLGIVECQQYLKELKTPILIRKGWSMDRTAFEAMTIEDFVALVQNGDWQPVKGSKQFTDNTPDPTTEEYSGGVMSVVRNGKPQYQFDYDKGIAFHKALYSKNSFGAYNMGLVDAAGTLVLVLSADGTRVTGLSASMVNTRTFKPASGDTSSITSFEFQLDNEDQFNRRMALYSTDQSGVDFNEELDAIVGVTITGTADAGDPILVQVNAVSNGNYGINGLTADNFRVTNTVTNAVVPLTSVSAGATDGSYLLTPTTATTAGQILKVELYDADEAVAVALIEPNQLYRGATLPPYITVASVIVVGLFSSVFSNLFG